MTKRERDSEIQIEDTIAPRPTNEFCPRRSRDLLGLEVFHRHFTETHDTSCSGDNTCYYGARHGTN
ncbi:hypothetical protein J6590_076262 [Homalodisca vitripennis]|nr:hypothetical protein J6590_076262 [Homalodisca vitripennis]